MKFYKHIIVFFFLLIVVKWNLFSQENEDCGGDYISIDFSDESSSQFVSYKDLEIKGYCWFNYSLFVDSFSTDWIQVSKGYDGFTISCSENRDIDIDGRNIDLFIGYSDPHGYFQELAGIWIYQSYGNYTNWYPDSDGDGFGDYLSTPEVAPRDAVKPGYVTNNDDHCPQIFSEDFNGCLEPDENRNWTRTKSFAIDGRLLGSQKSYFNDFGKVIQNQTYDVKYGRIWANQTIYDSQGRPALQTLSAPITAKDALDSPTFKFKNDFVTNQNGTNFSKVDFENDIENPSTILSAEDEYDLGWYTSKYNTDSLQDKTDRPYSRTVFSDLNPGAVLKTIGGNKINGEWKQGFSYTFPAAQEMQYVFGKDYFKEGSYEFLNNDGGIQTYYSNLKIFYNNPHEGYTACEIHDEFSHSYLYLNIIAPEMLVKGRFYKLYLNETQEEVFVEVLETPNDFGVHNPEEQTALLLGMGWDLCADVSNETNDSQGFIYKNFNSKATKTVVQDIHGEESVVFTDTDGKTLASARSGGATAYEVLSLIGKQKFVDIHIPLGCDNSVSFVGAIAGDFKIWNLRTDQEETGFSESYFPAGFYRIEYVGSDMDHLNYPGYTMIDASNKVVPVLDKNIGIRYTVNYYDYALQYYDKAGRLVKSTQPLGFDATALEDFKSAATLNHTLASTFKYNALGQLLETKSPDEGTAQFKYRKDGQIRFSQNSKQANALAEDGAPAPEFSYTNYDALARPIESGVAVGAFSNLVADEDSFDGRIKLEEKQETIYDSTGGGDHNFAGYGRYLAMGEGLYNLYEATFLSGNVVATQNNQTTTWYSYDIYGRVKWVVQDIEGLGVKTIDYNYDPVTSAVTEVDYQRYGTDRFVHRYTYDPVSNELTDVATSDISLKTQETMSVDAYEKAFVAHASYEYYETGALKRKILKGEDNSTKLQGIDYTYNLAGQLKAINHPDLTAITDPGGDDNDAFGMLIDYYNGDYQRENQFKSTPLNSKGIDQYNGNIKAITWSTNVTDYPEGKQSYYYKYNRNNWLEAASLNNELTDTNTLDFTVTRNSTVTETESVMASREIVLKPGFEVKASANLTFSAFIVQDEIANDDYAVYGLDYDANGNIQALNRNKNTEGGSNEMDKLRYVYKDGKKNQLLRVDDAVTRDTNADDIKDQNGENYKYNSIGQLIENVEEGIEYTYTASGLVFQVKKNNVPLVKFFYNDKGFRVRKEIYHQGNLNRTQYYVRDVAGSVMAIYEGDTQIELPIYGASRLGVYKKGQNVQYELTDHLGNVRAVVDKTDPTPSIFADYYPGGMQMPNRNSIDGSYRYAYQGQEKDPETGKEAFQLRLYDSRINRWLTTDPAGQYSSPYLAMGNDWVNGVDPDGAFKYKWWAKTVNFLVGGNGVGFNETKGEYYVNASRTIYEAGTVSYEGKDYNVIHEGVGFERIYDNPKFFIEGRAGLSVGPQLGAEGKFFGADAGIEGHYGAVDLDIGLGINNKSPYYLENLSGVQQPKIGYSAGALLVSGSEEWRLPNYGSGNRVGTKLSQSIDFPLLGKTELKYDKTGLQNLNTDVTQSWEVGGRVSALMIGVHASFKVGYTW